MQPVDLLKKAQQLSGSYENVVVAENNDHMVRISRMTEPYFWHCHPDSDETFIGLDGTLVLELEDKRIELGPGQLYTVPRGVKHRTFPAGPYSVNLTVERAGIETVRAEPAMPDA
jgi:mannose-6-phosphate isomerase-like protein (cupin superfamily)